MSSIITEKTEVSIDFPEKFYVGSFARGDRYDVKADQEGIHLYLDRQKGEKRKVGFHIHYHLLAEILGAMAEAIDQVDGIDAQHQEELIEAAKQLART